MFKLISRCNILRPASVLRNPICTSHVRLCVRGFHFTITRNQDKKNASDVILEVDPGQDAVKLSPNTPISYAEGSSKIGQEQNATNVTTTADEKVDAENEFCPEKVEDLLKTGLVNPELVKALSKAGFKNLTAIQKMAVLPMIKTKNGLVCRAKTGTGKSLTFIIPTIEKAIKNIKTKGVKSLVIAPTRDLALQIVEHYRKIINELPPKLRPRIGMTIGSSRNVFNERNPEDIVVSTPGRLERHLRDRSFGKAFSNLQFRVYDEADKLLEAGFKQTLDKIDRLLYQHRDNPAPIKSVLLSATVDDAILEFAQLHISPDYDFLNTVDPSEADVSDNVYQVLVKCEDVKDKIQSSMLYILDIIKKENDHRILVFLPTKIAVDWFTQYFEAIAKEHGCAKISINLIHGDKSVGQRKRSLDVFGKSNRSILIATDVVARGIDIKNISHVIQLFPSNETAQYVHKVGRTGRAGQKGIAALFSSINDERFLELLQLDVSIEFDETTHSKNIEKFQVFGQFKTNEDVATNLFVSNMSYTASNTLVFKNKMENLVKENVELHRLLINDPEAKLDAKDLSSLKKQIRFRELAPYLDNAANFAYAGKRKYDDFTRYGKNSNYRNNSNRGNYKKDFGSKSSRNYGDNRGRSYGDNRGRSYGDNEGRSYGDNRGRSYGDNRGKSYGDNEGKSYGDNRKERRPQKSYSNKHREKPQWSD